MRRPAPEWLVDVLTDLERAMILLVDAQVGRAAIDTECAVQRADELIEQARSVFRRKSAVLDWYPTKRAAAIFAAAYALRCRVAEQHGRADLDLVDLVRQVERPAN